MLLINVLVVSVTTQRLAPHVSVTVTVGTFPLVPFPSRDCWDLVGPISYGPIPIATYCIRQVVPEIFYRSPFEAMRILH